MEKLRNKHTEHLTQCPLPQWDFDRITLAHGSGGLLTHRLLTSGVFSLLKNDLLDTHHDGACLALSGRTAFTTDSFVVSPVFFPGGNIGSLAVNGTVNDLAMCGALPLYLSLSLIIEEGLPVEELWTILQTIQAACTEAGVLVVTGDTKVVEKGKGDKIFINTTGVGTIHERAAIGTNRVQPGDRIIVSGEIATHGIAILSVRQGLQFETELKTDSRSLWPPVRTLLDEFGGDVHFLRDPTRGGLATVLNELATDSGWGIDLVQDGLPINGAVEGACEMLGLDPLYVANEGVFIAAVHPEAAEDMVAALRKTTAARSAAIIGTVTQEHPGQLILLNNMGGKRSVPMLTGDPLPRIC